jgi:SAM-dependent methyltransferase
VADCIAIPFKDHYFDVVIANHVLFYVSDLNLGLKEIRRVLKNNGTLYCSAYGRNHMKEITALCQEFDERIVLADKALYEVFGLENGKDILECFFPTVQLKLYQDSLEITEIQPLMEYILSCHGSQLEILSERMDAFRQFLQHKLEAQGSIHVTKEAGVFIARMG